MMHELGSAEAVAYALFECVCYAEEKDVGLTPNVPASWKRPSRRWIFSTYAECLKAVRSPEEGGYDTSLEARTDAAGHRYVPRADILAGNPV
jgi:hypothetical protein